MRYLNSLPVKEKKNKKQSNWFIVIGSDQTVFGGLLVKIEV